MFSRITKNIKHNILPYRNIAHIPERSYDINEAINNVLLYLKYGHQNLIVKLLAIEQHKLNKLHQLLMVVLIHVP